MVLSKEIEKFKGERKSKTSDRVRPENARFPNERRLPLHGDKKPPNKHDKLHGTNRREVPKNLPVARSTAGVKPKTRPRRETFHAVKMQKALVTVPYGERSAIKSQIRPNQSFGRFPLLECMHEAIADQALRGLEIQEPTPVQKLAIPALLGIGSKRQSGPSLAKFLIAAETGSGKTLAYLVPVLDALKRAEDLEKVEDVVVDPETPHVDAPHPTTGRPRVVILLPTAELVTQVGNVAKSMSHKAKFRTAMISAAYTAKVIRSRLFAPTGIDLLVTTPHLLASIAESDPNVLSRVSHLVIDEADSLLDRSFAPSTLAVVDRATPSLRQLVLCSATIPRSLDAFLEKRFPDITRIVTPNLHAIPRRVQLGVVDVDRQPFAGNKLLAMADSIWSIGKAAERNQQAEMSAGEPVHVLVFVNEREQTQVLADFLTSKGISAMALQRDMVESRQQDVLADFTSSDKKIAPVPESGSPRRLAGVKVLVATDLGSRGIDTVAVKHVILYDVPHTTIDFIHRLGRVGRMNRRGRGIVLVGRKDRKDIVREVQDGMFKGQALI